ncbi:MAG: HAMP domain-containing histidine kinase [Anaerolineae bacterium]|nr:HAMP domain-containing histidine kinase [Anaerolineae bacterium]
MIPESIRWRLPLSYAAIALVAALALGAVLLTTLRSYYADQEAEYLRNNATVISTIVERGGLQEKTSDVMDAQLRTLSFLSQVRVRLLDADLQPVSDSGAPQDNNYLTISYRQDPQPAPADQTTQESGTTTTISPSVFIYPLDKLSPPQDITAQRWRDRKPPVIVISDSSQAPVQDQAFWVNFENAIDTQHASFVPATRSLYGFRLNAETFPNEVIELRSDQTVQAPIYDRSGTVNGYIELSNGPAYGMEIVNGVARAWILASAVAILLAAAMGLVISRSLSAPLVALTDITKRMTGGDLSARAKVASGDEVGILAHSFNEMAARVEDTIFTLRRFVADAAHELHTPLTALRTNIELIGEEMDSTRRDLFVERAQAQVMRLETLTSSLLELSRLEAGMLPLDSYELADLNTLVRETSELYASQAEQSGLDFVLELPKQPVWADVHESQLRRALSNLLENAIKFTPEGGTITIGLCQKPDGIELWVQDTGIGIPEEDIPQLFSRFHRGRNAFQMPGSGLGLAIVKAIADYHHGQVRAENMNQGARLSLHLPA